MKRLVVLQANDICNKFKGLFPRYARCHNLFNSSMYFEESDIVSLQVAIDDLLSYFREG